MHCNMLQHHVVILITKQPADFMFSKELYLTCKYVHQFLLVKSSSLLLTAIREAEIQEAVITETVIEDSTIKISPLKNRH